MFSKLIYLLLMTRYRDFRVVAVTLKKPQEQIRELVNTTSNTAGSCVRPLRDSDG